MSSPDAMRLAAWFVQQVRSVRSSENCGAPSAHEIWSHLITNAWFKAVLQQRARRAAQRTGLGAAWADDVADDTILRLHKQMQADPTLSFDLARGEGCFSAWIGTILYRQALKASTKLNRQVPAATRSLDSCPAAEDSQASLPEGATPSADPAQTTPRSMTQAIRLAKRLNKFPNTKRAIAHRMAKGHSLKQIARDLEMSYKSVRKHAAEIRETLRNEFADDDC